jgi:hypothetical protein
MARGRNSTSRCWIDFVYREVAVFTHRKKGPAGGVAAARAGGVGRTSSKAAVRISRPVNFFTNLLRELKNASETVI